MTLKRKSTWVRRYAIIQDSIFIYKNKPTDKNPKFTIDMKKAKVMLGQKDNSMPYIYIQPNPLKSEAVRVSFDTEREFNKWLETVQWARKSEQQKREIQRTKTEIEQRDEDDELVARDRLATL